MRVLTAILLLIFYTNAYAGEFFIDGHKDDGALCPWLDGDICMFGVFKGPIEKGDTDKIASEIRELNVALENEAAKQGSKRVQARLGLIQLSSNGGDVYEAMRMGEWFREHKVQVINPADSPCYSACVFALAGGVMRISSNVGLHAFFSQESKNPNFDYDAENIKYQKVEKDIRDYLQRMRIPTALLDEALQTPSSRVRVLTQEEAYKFGLVVGFDPLFHQMMVAKGYLKPQAN